MNTVVSKKDLLYFVDAYIRERPLFLSFIRPQEAALFKKFTSLLHPPILDYGCGDGFFAERVFGKKIIDVGLDIPGSRAEEAKRKKVYKRIVSYEGIHIPFPKHSFNTIVSNCVLEHVEHIESALVDIARVLKPGGYFLASVMADNWEDYLLGSKVFGERYKAYMRKKQVHYNLFSKRNWEELFAKNNLISKDAIGYLSQSTASSMDLFHYVSFPSLITHTLFGKWVVFPSLWAAVFTQFIANKISFTKTPEKSAAIFFVLQKR